MSGDGYILSLQESGTCLQTENQLLTAVINCLSAIKYGPQKNRQNFPKGRRFACAAGHGSGMPLTMSLTP